MGAGTAVSPVAAVALADALADALLDGVAEGDATTSSSVVAHTSLLNKDGPVAVTLFILKQYSVSGDKPLSCSAVSLTCGAGEIDDHPVRIWC